jgi:hypothetical protein
MQGPSGPPSPPPEPALPITLARNDVLAGMVLVKNQVSFCLRQDNQPGPVTVAVEIEGTGHVVAARVEGSLAGSSTASCVEGAVSRALFRRFSGRDITVRYPFTQDVSSTTTPAVPAAPAAH